MTLPYREVVLKTPFHERTAPLNVVNEWQRWSGYTTAAEFRNAEFEYFAIRNTATLYDISPMTKYRIRGAGAERFLQRLQTRDLGRLRPGRVMFTVWCDDAGRVLDDGTLFRFAADDFRLCTQDRHLPWLLDAASGFEVEVRDESEAVAALSLQGPTSCAVLQRLGWTGIEKLKPFELTERRLKRVPVTVSRTGFTGDLGYELWVRPARALALWDGLMEAGAELGLMPIGSRALDLARIEAGFLQPHVDYIPAHLCERENRGRSPFELGLDWLVEFGKGHFNGRRALLAERQRGSRVRVVGLEVEGNKPARDALLYFERRTEAGAVTSAMWSPSAKRNIAIATVQSQYLRSDGELQAEIYTRRELEWRRTMARCRVVPRPFYATPRRLATPAGRF